MRTVLFAVLLVSWPVLAAEPAAGSDVVGQLTRMLLGLLLVVGLIFGLGWMLRRMQQFKPGGGQLIRTLAVQHLGPRDRLVLVQVGKEQILLGLSAGRITPLHVLTEPVEPPSTEPATPEFAQRLMELLGKDHKDKS
ncbi:flagellar biosynthetic protein FliO [Stutzerimonas tarimensis]|uniref:Flagellar protein n=1 Tax=Stutzerimonas tarimensis TaxID=1507735 RepID=A0ABV7T749_9GAMM